MPDVTVAVKGGSLHASRTWPQRPKFVQGSLEPVESSVLLPPPTPSLPPSLVGVFLNVTLRFTPCSLVCPGRLFVTGNTCPLPLFSSLFSPSFLSLLLVWVSLDAFVTAGNPSSLGVSLDACVATGNTFFSFPVFGVS